MRAGPLAGRTIAVTRPRAQAAELARLIEAAGGRALLAPLLDIAPYENPAPLHSAAARLAEAAFAVFISPNAAEYSLPAILAHGAWPVGTRPVAVGQGTVRSLAAYGVEGCIAPEQRFDSEALLERPELQADQVAGRKVFIFRGDGGRELLTEALRARGAAVECVPCYRRTPPRDGFAALRTAAAEGKLDALTISSSEGLHHLFDALTPGERERLAALPAFMPHARIAETARRLGIRHTILTEPGDPGIAASLCAYNWPSS